MGLNIITILLPYGETTVKKIKLNGKYIDKNDNIEIEFYGDKDILDKKDTNEIIYKTEIEPHT